MSSNTLYDPRHPIWIIAKALVFILAAYVCSKLTASNFDETERKMLYALATVLFGGTVTELIALTRKKE